MSVHNWINAKEKLPTKDCAVTVAIQKDDGKYEIRNCYFSKNFGNVLSPKNVFYDVIFDSDGDQTYDLSVEVRNVVFWKPYKNNNLSSEDIDTLRTLLHKLCLNNSEEYHSCNKNCKECHITKILEELEIDDLFV